MKIAIGGDHAGFELKKVLTSYLGSLGHEVEDMGPRIFDEADDYPDYCVLVAERVGKSEADKGIVIGSSGQGEAIAANRVRGVRAVVYYGGNKDIVRLSREHNDANVLSLGARFLTEEEARQALNLWLSTPFRGEERHARRIRKLG